MGQILADAKRLGYAEADESLDVEGWDTAHKAGILAFLAHGAWVPTKSMLVEGITRITPADLEFARDQGYAIKLLAVITRDFDRDELFVRVHPTLIPRDEGHCQRQRGLQRHRGDRGCRGRDDLHRAWLSQGRMPPPAPLVISDIADAVIALRGGAVSPPIPAADGPAGPSLAPLKRISGRYYLRLEVRDEPGVLAKIATATARSRVSIASVVQRPSARPGAATLVLTTHQSDEREPSGPRSAPSVGSPACWGRHCSCGSPTSWADPIPPFPSNFKPLHG